MKQKHAENAHFSISKMLFFLFFAHFMCDKTFAEFLSSFRAKLPIVFSVSIFTFFCSLPLLLSYPSLKHISLIVLLYFLVVVVSLFAFIFFLCLNS